MVSVKRQHPGSDREDGDRTDEGEIRSSVVSSQAELHARYGGVVPEIASRRHLELVTPVIREALAEAGTTLDDVDRVAVTQGPGLIGADHVAPGAVVIDVGINPTADGRVTGDVDAAAVTGRAAVLTPVPGGVGPVTTAMLMRHTVTAAATRSADPGGPPAGDGQVQPGRE